MSLDSLELQLASALQRYNNLQRRAEAGRESAALLARSLAELGAALEEVRVAQEQLIESRQNMELLQDELRVQLQRYWQLFDDIPEACVVTTPESRIIEANKRASELLNVTQRFLPGKVLSVFVCEDRGAFLETCARAARDAVTIEVPLKIRPRERAPLELSARVVGNDRELRWLLRPVSPV